MKENKNENVCERNFDGRFSGELCWEVVQQFMSEGPMNCFGGLSNRFTSEGCLIYLPNLGSKFSRAKSFCFENYILLAFVLGMCEGVVEDSRHEFGYVDIQVGSCICLSVIVCHDMCT